MLIVGLGAVAVTLFTPPVYQATALVKVDIPSTDTTIAAGVNRLTATQVQLATGSQVLTSVASHIPGVTVAKLRSEVTATQIPNSSLIQIVVRDTSPSLAEGLANDVARTLISQQSSANDLANRLAERQVLDDLASSNAQIVDALVEQAHLIATKAAETDLRAIQAKLDMLIAQQTQQEMTLAAIETNQSKKAYYLYLTQTAQVTAKSGRSSFLFIAGGLGLGLLTGLLLLLGLDLLNQKMKTPEALQDALLTPVLATFASPSEQDDMEGVRIWTTAAGAGQLLRALTFLHVQKPLRSVAVTGLRSEKYKDMVAATLAVASSIQGNAALLVDCDFEHPSQHAYFDVSNTHGVGGAILASLSSSAHAVTALTLEQYFEPPAAPTLGALRVLSAGPKPPNAAKVVASNAMKDVFAALTRSHAETITVDAPAIGRRNRGQDVCALADGALLVIDLATVRRYEAIGARQALESAGVTLLGCVVVTHDSAAQSRQSLGPEPQTRSAILEPL
jgi:Mrp family chromosome partitioning ATPase